MKLDQVKKMGKELSRSEKNEVLGGVEVKLHGACNNGAHFSIVFHPNTYQESLNQVNSTLCGGTGIAYHDPLPMQ